MATILRPAVRTAVQYGDRLRSDAALARKELGAYQGPIPRYLYKDLDETKLAEEIRRRWLMRRMEMSSRIAMDSRLLRYMDPEKVQDHWQNFWTGAPLRKLQHSTQLTIGVFNWPRAIIEALTGLLTGSDDGLAYNVDVVPRNSLDDVSRTQAGIVGSFLNSYWIPQTEYERTFLRGGSNIYSLGRRWMGVITQTDGPLKGLAKVDNAWPGSVTGFWHGNHETLECVIVASEMLPGVADAMYPGHTDEIAAATHIPAQWFRALGLDRPATTFDLNSTVTVLTCWARTSESTIGQFVVLMDAPLNSLSKNSNVVLLRKLMDSGYPDIPWRCTPRFKTDDRPPDEAQGALYDIAPIVTMYDETVSAARDMLWRAIYQRYKLSNAYGRPPELIPGTSIIALRAGQDLARLDDVLNSVPVDTFISRLEELLIIFPGLSRYFLGQAPPSETSGEAIDAAINASIQRQISTRTEVRTDERWMYRQVIAQAARFYKATVNGQSVTLGDVFQGDFDPVIRWDSDNPKNAVKAKQLALAALKAGVIALDTAQREWGITNPEEEQRKIRRYMSDPTLRPDIVALTNQALLTQLDVTAKQQALSAPPAPQEPPVRVSLTGQLPPDVAARLAQTIDPAAFPQPPAPPPSSPTGAQSGGKAAAASATIAGNMQPPQSESDNERVLPASQEGDQGQP